MNKEFGHKLYLIRTNLACNIPLLWPAMACFVLYFVVGVNELSANLTWLRWAFVALGVLLIAYVLYQIFFCHIMLHENAIVFKNVFTKKIIWRDDIAAIYWDKPGAYEGSTRGARKNTEVAQVILKNGKMVRISTGAYTGVPQQLGSWQSDYNIPQEL